MDQGHPEVTTWRPAWPRAHWTRAVLCLGLGLLTACGSSADEDAASDAAGGAGGEPADLPQPPPYAESVESFQPGEAAGYNEAKLPDIVLGPPQGKGNSAGSLDVLSLGVHGEIVLGFGDQVMIDGPGADLIVFENPFWPSGDASQVFAELGEVSVSEDGETWHTFTCDTAGDGNARFPGCAGFTPTLVYDAETLIPLDPEQTGGDAFDLADLSVERARFVKIRDLATLEGATPSAGFDLDAVGIVNVE
jgi:hypothetical protein